MTSPRLLTKSQAAQYCGLSPATFGTVCPVHPIALGEGVRMHRYDVHEIDKWIDGLQGNSDKPSKLADILLERLRSPSSLADKHVKVLRYMRDHPECDTASEIRGAGEQTLRLLEAEGMVRIAGTDPMGKNRFVLTKAGKQEMRNIEQWEMEKKRR